jgi:Spy/CpxP family protein refolding chaperone
MNSNTSRPWLALLFASALALPAFAAHASPPGPDPERIQARMQEAAERLQLSDAQKQQLKPIVEEHVAQVRALRDKYPPETSRDDRRAMHQEMRGVRDAYEARVRAILTPQQQQEWERMRAEARDRMREQMRQGRGPAGAGGPTNTGTSSGG